MTEEDTAAAANVSPEDAARIAAEARRKRILEKSKDRMGIVSGESQDKAEASGNSRMQAMRRRRYQQKKSKPQETETEKQKEKGEAKEETEKQESASKVVETTADTTVEEKAPTITEPSTTTRKYQGVAKVRRKALKEKQAAAAAAKKDEATSATSMLPPPTAIASTIPFVHVGLQAVAVILLFLVGFQVGLQHDAVGVLTVHRKLSPQENGVGMITAAFMERPALTSDIFVEESVSFEQPLGVQEEEEFGGGTNADSITDDSSDEKEPNIDPVFQVDLDQFTQGPGLFMWLARGAVRAHRWNLWLFYHVPKSILATLMQLPQLLMATPPVFFLLSLLIRQVTQRLGGDFTKPEQEKQSKDVLAMMRGFVISFLSNAFPTAVTLYNVWTHLRSDMYVVMCGLFCGIAYMHTTFGGVLEEKVDQESYYQKEEEYVPVDNVMEGDEL